MSPGLLLLLLLLPVAPSGDPTPERHLRSAVPPSAGARAAAATPAEEFQRGRNSFDRGEYARAIEILLPLLYPDIRLESEAQIVLGHRMLGIAHLFANAEDEAAQEFRKLLQLRPDYRFDPLLDPPKVVDFFNGVLREHAGEVALLEAKRREAERARQRDREECERALGGPTVIERKVGRNSFAISFVPFGAGQFQNGHRIKGWAFLLGETVLGATSVGAFTANLALYGLRPKRACQYDISPCPAQFVDYSADNRSRWLLRTQVASGGLFFAVAIWGIVDAVRHYAPETHLADTPLASAAARPSTWNLTPIALPHALGPGLAFRF